MFCLFVFIFVFVFVIFHAKHAFLHLQSSALVSTGWFLKQKFVFFKFCCKGVGDHRALLLSPAQAWDCWWKMMTVVGKARGPTMTLHEVVMQL